MRYFFIFIFLAVCNGLSFFQDNSVKKKPESNLINYNISLDRLLDSLKLNKMHAKIHVSKLKYLLSISIDTRIIKSYPIVLGTDPVNDKLREGDRCTPEGKFKIKAMYPHKSWSKFIWFDYPNAESYEKHNLAKKNKVIPSNATIGGEVGIHGVPGGADYVIDMRQNWTWGCISLKNNDINEIYKFAFIGMIVEIEK
jgi:murein L,D-transpeptidase YafK